MNMFPHVVTLYNVERRRDPENPTREIVTNHITVLQGVLLDAVKAANVQQSGLVSADAVMLYIPFGCKAVDPYTQQSKEYCGPVQFWKTEEDKSKMWTLSTGENSWFVKGIALPSEGTPPDKVDEEINLKFDRVYTINKVDEKDFGGLQHFEVGAT